MNNKIVILGASGHGSVVAEIAQLNGYSTFFLDDDEQKAGHSINGVECIGKLKKLRELCPKSFLVALGVGDNKTRKRLYKLVNDLGFQMPNLIHPTAVVSESSVLGDANLVGCRAILNPHCSIANGSIINTSAVVEHHVSVASFVHLSPGSILCGAANVGEACWIGANATIIECVRLQNNITIGANSCVINDIDAPGCYAGSPTRRIS